MDAKRWRELKEVVADALERPAAERRASLVQADLKTGDYRRVEAYLAAYENDPEFLEDRIDPEISLSSTNAGPLQPGAVVNDYRILRKIAEGGMGEIFEAEQIAPIRRRVALKLVRHASFDPQVLARFEVERQALASMRHPHIAQVFAAGEFNGRPYLVMEMVDGLPITRYCDRNRLSIEDRIALFVKLCQGVQHAHQRGVIHRDLKPSNVLIDVRDGQPSPKVIDFGISKVTAENSPHLTEQGQWLGTPDYMSPEQAAGGTLDTRSDVYSLGVLLYELLTGCLPFETTALRLEGLDVLIRTLREVAPVRPSRRCDRRSQTTEGQDVETRAADRALKPEELAQRLAGDLDLVVLKALRKDPEQRYASPLELAQDLLRHLDHRPLLAVEPSTGYTLRKLLRRHRLGFAAAAMVLATLMLGMVGTSLGLIRAQEAEQEAQTRAEEAQAEAERANREAATATRVTDFMVSVFRASDLDDASNRPGTTLRQVLDRGAQRIRNELRDEPQVQARLMTAIGQAYSSLSLFLEARALLEEAVELLEQTSPDSPELALTLHHLGNNYGHRAEYETALLLLRRCLDIRRRILGEKHYEVSWVLHDIGRILSSRGQMEESIRTFEQALALKREIYGDEHLEVSSTLNSLGLRMVQTERIEEGLPMLERSLAIQEEHLESDHPMLAAALTNLAETHGKLGDYETANRLQQRALAIDEKALGEDHHYVALSLMNLAEIAWKGFRDCDVALTQAQRGKAILERHYPPEHPNLKKTLQLLATYKAECGEVGIERVASRGK